MWRENLGVAPAVPTGSQTRHADATPVEFVFMTNDGFNNASVYTIESSGALTKVKGSPFAAGNGPVDIAINPTGKFAYIGNEFGGDVSAYAIESSGVLKQVKGSPFAAGKVPSGIATL